MTKTLSKGISFKEYILKINFVKNTYNEKKLISTRQRKFCLCFLKKIEKNNILQYPNDKKT